MLKALLRVIKGMTTLVLGSRIGQMGQVSENRRRNLRRRRGMSSLIDISKFETRVPGLLSVLNTTPNSAANYAN